MGKRKSKQSAEASKRPCLTCIFLFDRSVEGIERREMARAKIIPKSQQRPEWTHFTGWGLYCDKHLPAAQGRKKALVARRSADAERKLCRGCLSLYRHSSQGHAARNASERREPAPWGKGKWPEKLYFSGAGTRCASCAGTRNAHSARQRAKKIQRTPAWADMRAIAAIYRQCSRISRETGIMHHVDHVVPLNGARVSGLHVACNLRIIQGVENLGKSNIFDPHDPSIDHDGFHKALFAKTHPGRTEKLSTRGGAELDLA